MTRARRRALVLAVIVSLFNVAASGQAAVVIRHGEDFPTNFDLADNALIIQATAESLDAILAQLTEAVSKGFNEGTWDGPGIRSSVAAADNQFLRGIGILVNDNGLGQPWYDTFAGQSVDTLSILVRTTYYGDADLNGVVDGTDYALIDNGFNAQLKGWLNGDFNHDGTIDGTDYALIDNAFNSTGRSDSAWPAPQPLPQESQLAPEVSSFATWGLLIIAAGLFSRRFRRLRPWGSA